MRIQHNIMAMNAYRNYNNNTSALSKNLEKLSSGYKINRAGDDAAGLAISEKMRAQITGLNAATKNVKDGISLVKTGEGAMQEIQDMLNRMDYLATQSANGTYDNEVDRANLQKEVKALKEEINRIADSANFNGIKLLDGKTGLNNNAFTLGTASSVDAVNPGDITINFAAPTAAADDVHETLPSVAAQTAEFTVDLGDLQVDASAGDAVLTITFGGQAVTVSLASNGGSSSDGKWSAADIADALVTKLGNTANNPVTVGTTFVGTVSFGGFNFQVSAVTSSNAGTGDNAIKFTLVGANGKELKADDMTSTQADAINRLAGIAGGDVSIGSNQTNTKITGTFNHKVDDVKSAVAKDPGKKAGITFDLTADMLTEDVELVIDGTTFTFLTDTSNTAGATSTQIDLRDVIKAGGNTTAQLTEAINQLSQKSTDNFDITKKADGKLHIEQKSTSTEEYDYKKLTETVTATNNGAAQPAKNAGSTIAIDSTKVAFGDKLTIGGKTFVFQDDASKVGDDEIQVNGKTATDLMNAINNDSTLGFTAELDPADSNKVIVRSSGAIGTAAPLVGGTGLTLQIGDTSDDFNQMNLKIDNMHVNAMGTMDANGNVTKSIEDIDISTQAGAQEAVDVIKNAINYVSSVRGDLGAIQNRLEHTQNNLSVMAENIQDAESTIRDTDVAEEMMSYVKNNILVQSAQAMLAQANQVPQGVLQLLG